MPLVLFDVSFDKPNPRVVPAETRAVAGEAYAHVDDEAGNPGGITAADVADDYIRQLDSFEHGAEVFVEGEPDDVLDDEEPVATRIWWRARVILAVAPGGSA